ncbi:MAG: hypothetical protein MJZ61_00210 [Bacteroidales bacterium]|nr:hypothetical protein [Bacteroidales bacterium]
MKHASIIMGIMAILLLTAVLGTSCSQSTANAEKSYVTPSQDLSVQMKWIKDSTITCDAEVIDF